LFPPLVLSWEEREIGKEGLQEAPVQETSDHSAKRRGRCHLCNILPKGYLAQSGTSSSERESGGMRTGNRGGDPMKKK